MRIALVVLFLFDSSVQFFREQREDTQAALGHLLPEQAEKLVTALSAHQGLTVDIVTYSNEDQSDRLAEDIEKVFKKAHWKTTGSAGIDRSNCVGLQVLFWTPAAVQMADGFSVPKEAEPESLNVVTRAFEAVGIPTTVGVDQTVGTERIRLWVGHVKPLAPD